jgi:acyl carrier protein
MDEREPSQALKRRIKQLIVERLKLEIDPESIDDTAPLFGDSGLGLDSIDALEMVLAIEQTFGVRIEDEEIGSRALSSIDALAAFVASEIEPAGDVG